MKSVGHDLDRAVELYVGGSTVAEARGVTAPPITTYRFYKELQNRGIQPRGAVSRKIEVPEGSLLQCRNCGVELEQSEFSRHSGCTIGYDTSRCKSCKTANTKSVNAWANKSLEAKIHNRTKTRAKERGIPFDLNIEDIVVPDVCPVFGMPFIYGDHLWTASIDRVKPELGYVKGNIIIISNKANMMKSTATCEEVGLLYKWFLTLEE